MKYFISKSLHFKIINTSLVIAKITLGIFLLLSSTVFADTERQKLDKVVSIGGSVTEIVYELGEADRLVARDSTSTYPNAATLLPDVGYMRALSPEGILSVDPNLIIAEDGSGPQETIDLLTQASVPFVKISDGFTRQGIIQKILEVGDALGVKAKAEKVAARINDELMDAESKSNQYSGKRKKVLFILSTRGGKILASGSNTAADGIIKMAGAINAVNSFNGYKPLSDEAVTVAAPDVILMMDRRGNHGTDDEELFSMPSISTTPAAKTKSLIRMNGLYLLGFGPRTASAINELRNELYSD